jgi:hypothetical protein
VLGEL